MFQGKTDAQGNFATPTLEAGAYNVEFRSPKIDLKGKQLAISISAGKTAPRQVAAEGEHMRYGVGVNVDVKLASRLSGHVTARQGTGPQTARVIPKDMEEVRANVKVMNGKRYVWVPGALGSNMGGKWAEEGTEEARLSTSNKKGEDGQVLKHIQDQSSNVGRRGN